MTQLGALCISNLCATKPAEIIRSGVLSLVQLENINLILQNSNYLLSTTKSVFQHFWALSIQLQFYLIYPLVFILLKHKKLIALTLISLVSFLYSINLVSTDPAVAYYHPLSRLWEFTIGGIVFLLYKQNATIKYGIVSTLALIVFILFAFLYPKDFNFPGFSSLIPVICASLILLNTGKSSLFSTLGRNKTLISISKFSFTLYLVHWPVLIFTKYLSFNNTISIFNGFLIIIISIVISYLIYTLFEVKTSKFLKYLSITTFYKVVFLVLITCILFYVGLFIKNKILERNSLQKYTNKNTLSKELNLNILSLRTLGASVRSREICPSKSSNINTCIWGSKNSNHVIAIIGGSHIEQWIPIFDKFGTDHNYKVLQISKNGCPLGGIENSTKECLVWSNNVIEYVKNNKSINYIVLNSTRTYKDEGHEDIPQSYLSSFKKLKQNSTAKLIGVRDNPRFNIDPNQCLINPLKKSEQCNYPLYQHIAFKDPSLRYQSLITSIDFSPLYCTDPKQCKFNYKNVPMFEDDNHLSFIYVQQIADQASQLLENAMLP